MVARNNEADDEVPQEREEGSDVDSEDELDDEDEDSWVCRASDWYHRPCNVSPQEQP